MTLLKVCVSCKNPRKSNTCNPGTGFRGNVLWTGDKTSQKRHSTVLTPTVPTVEHDDQNPLSCHMKTRKWVKMNKLK